LGKEKESNTYHILERQKKMTPLLEQECRRKLYGRNNLYLKINHSGKVEWSLMRVMGGRETGQQTETPRGHKWHQIMPSLPQIPTVFVHQET
jgi:hypothetical protein